VENIIDSCEDYVNQTLSRKKELEGHLGKSTILLNSYRNNLIWDIMVLLDDEEFKQNFAPMYGETFAVDDHEHQPPVFTRVKCYNWLEGNFKQRLPIALWVFGNAGIVRQEGEWFSKFIAQQRKKFAANLPQITKGKYLEMRGERHNLRYIVREPDDISHLILKANIVKLCFELCLLAEGNPYPFKALLPSHAQAHSETGRLIFPLSQDFLRETNPTKVISLSDELIENISSMLRKTGWFSNEFLAVWWLQLE
jgi:hypothetical protein